MVSLLYLLPSVATHKRLHPALQLSDLLTLANLDTQKEFDLHKNMSDFHSSVRFTSSKDGDVKETVPQNISQWLRAIGDKIGGSIFRVLHDGSMKALSKSDFLKAKILPDFMRVGMFLNGSEGGTCNETKIENLFDGLSLHSLQSLDFQFVVKL